MSVIHPCWIEPRPLHKPGRYSAIELYPCVPSAPPELGSDYLEFCGIDKFNLTKSERASSTFAPTKGLVPTSKMLGQMHSPHHMEAELQDK